MPDTLRELPDSAATLRDYHAVRNVPKQERQFARGGLNTARQRTERAHLLHAVTTTDPLVERLVMFWANHFTVSRMRASIGHAIPA